MPAVVRGAFHRNVFPCCAQIQGPNVVKMFNHAQESKKVSREKVVAVVSELKAMKLPETVKKVETGIEENQTYCDFPSEHWVKIQTNDVIERMLRDTRCRIHVVGALLDSNSALMLVCVRLRRTAEIQWGARSTLTQSIRQPWNKRYCSTDRSRATKVHE